MIPVSDTLYFGRTAEGDVRLVVLAAKPELPPQVRDALPGALLDVVIPSEQWCRAVAGVSRLGDQPVLVYRAQVFHFGR